jgi:hypothetical protein
LLNFRNNNANPEANANTVLQDNRPQILKDLDDFNTADTANKGILGGILEEQYGERAEQEGGQQEQESTPAAPRERNTQRETSPESMEKFYAPLNSSMQEMRATYERQNSELRQEINAMRREAAMREQSSRQQQQQAQIDPNEPVNYGHLQGVEQKQQSLEQNLWAHGMRSEFQRAQIALLMFKSANPDYNVGMTELTDSFNKFSQGDPNRVTNVNWEGVFAANHQQASGKTLREENERLKRENEDLKKGKGGSASVPANTQRKNVSEAHTLSPAVRSSGRAIQTVGDASGDDVINLPSFRKGKGFKNYGRELQRGGFLK